MYTAEVDRRFWLNRYSAQHALSFQRTGIACNGKNRRLLKNEGRALFDVLVVMCPIIILRCTVEGLVQAKLRFPQWQ